MTCRVVAIYTCIRPLLMTSRGRRGTEQENLHESLFSLPIKEVRAAHVEIDLNFFMHLRTQLRIHPRRECIPFSREFENDF